MRFEIVIVKKSLDAANAITAGKISSRARSMISAIMLRLVRPSANCRYCPALDGSTLRRDITTDGK